LFEWQLLLCTLVRVLFLIRRGTTTAKLLHVRLVAVWRVRHGQPQVYQAKGSVLKRAAALVHHASSRTFTHCARVQASAKKGKLPMDKMQHAVTKPVETNDDEFDFE
jgi:hypothetical protein